MKHIIPLLVLVAPLVSAEMASAPKEQSVFVYSDDKNPSVFVVTTEYDEMFGFRSEVWQPFSGPGTHVMLREIIGSQAVNASPSLYLSDNGAIKKTIAVTWSPDRKTITVFYGQGKTKILMVK